VRDKTKTARCFALRAVDRGNGMTSRDVFDQRARQAPSSRAMAIGDRKVMRSI
jgi:hypothetical protein